MAISTSRDFSVDIDTIYCGGVPMLTVCELRGRRKAREIETIPMENFDCVTKIRIFGLLNALLQVISSRRTP